MTPDETELLALRALASGITGRNSEDIFSQLVEKLAGIASADIVFLGQFPPIARTTVSTLAMWMDGKIAPNVLYDIENTPCKEVLRRSFSIYPDKVQVRFPNDVPLREKNVASYAGITLCDSSGRPLGLLSVLSRKPFPDPHLLERLLRLFANRASTELERKWIREELNRSQANLSALIENTDDLIWSVEASEFRLVACNAAFRQYAWQAYEIEVQAGMTPQDFLPETIASLWTDFYRQTLAAGSRRISYHLDDNSGFMELSLNSIVEDGVVTGLSVFGKDITVRKRTEEELQASREHLEETVRLRTAELREKNERLAREVSERAQAQEAIKRFEFIVNSIPDLISLIDRDFTYQIVNDAWCNTHQHIRDEACGMPVSAIWGQKAYQEFVKEHLENCFAGRSTSFDLWLMLGVVGRRYCNVSMFPYRDAAGKVIYAITMTRDIDVEHQAKTELIEARKAAEDASRAKSAFLANVSHEIRTPMNAIIGLSHLLELTELGAKQRDYLSKIDYSAQNLLRIINDILDFSKVEAGKVEFEHVEFSPGDVVAEILHLASLQARPKKIEVRTSVSENVPPVLLGDPLRLGQVLSNLAGNAVKFTQEGRVDLTVDRVTHMNGRATLLFTVRDTGIGMSAEQLGRLFVPFSQANATTARKYGGTGLGLVICKRYIELMGGVLAVESVPGQGTTFHFELAFDVAQRNSQRPSRPAPNARQSTLVAVSDPDAPWTDTLLQGRRILLVEDNEINQEVAAEILRLAGCEVTIAGDGTAALAALRNSGTGAFDAVLMDLQMPDMDGFSATEAIRRSPRFATLPIIAMTADAISGVKEKCLAAGMNDYLTKPIEVSALHATLKRWIGPENEKNSEPIRPAGQAGVS